MKQTGTLPKVTICPACENNSDLLGKLECQCRDCQYNACSSSTKGNGITKTKLVFGVTENKCLP